MFNKYWELLKKKHLVRRGGLEPPRLSAYAPQAAFRFYKNVIISNTYASNQGSSDIRISPILPRFIPPLPPSCSQMFPKGQIISI